MSDAQGTVTHCLSNLCLPEINVDVPVRYARKRADFAEPLQCEVRHCWTLLVTQRDSPRTTFWSPRSGAHLVDVSHR